MKNGPKGKFSKSLSIWISALMITSLALVMAAQLASADPDVTVTPATGGEAISADDFGTGAWTTLTEIVITEGAVGDIAVGDFVLTIPDGFEFDTTSVPDVAVDGTSTLAATTPATITATTITVTVTAASSETTTGELTIGGTTPIKVRPTAGTPLASGDITMTSGTIAGVTIGETNFGTLNEVAGTFAKYTVVPAGLTQTAGTPFTVTITAADQFGNPAVVVDATLNGYTFTFSGPASAPDETLPTYPDTPDFSGGVWSPDVTLVKAETVGLTVTDSQDPSMTGTSANITVDPDVLNHYNVVPAAEPYTAGVAFDVTITAVDQFENPLGADYVTDEPYTWETNASNAPDETPPSIGTVAAVDFTDGVATKSVTLYCAEPGVTFTITDTNTITGTSDPITVNPAAELTEFEAQIGAKTATVTFSGGVYTDIDTGVLAVADFTYTDDGTGAGSITSVSHLEGGDIAVVTLDVQATSSDIGSDTINAVTNQIMDSFGNPISAATKTMANARNALSLENGWNLVSVPKVPSAGWDIVNNLSDPSDYIVAYTYGWHYDPVVDNMVTGWYEVTDMDSLDAVFLKVAKPTELALSWTTDPQTAPPTKFLYPGWNLVGPNMDPATEPSLEVETVLRSLTMLMGQYGGGTLWSTVFSPGYNIEPWTCVSKLDPAGSGNIQSEPTSYMRTYEGYWVYIQWMSAELAGRTT